MKTVLISGINGFLGSHLAKQLNSFYKIVGLEYSLDNLNRVSTKDFDIYLSTEKGLLDAFESNKFFAIIHAATIYNRKSEQISNLLKTNVNLPVRLLELANYYKVSIFLNTDSFFNNSNFSYSFLTQYTLSKKHSLEWIKLYSEDARFKVVNMKIYHMYGERDNQDKFIPSITNKIISNEKSIDLTAGDQTRDFIYIKDVVNAFEYVLKSYSKLKKFEEFDIATGSSISLKEFVLYIKKVTQSNTELNFGKLPYREGEIMVSKTYNLSLFKMGWKPLYNQKKGVQKYISEIIKIHS